MYNEGLIKSEKYKTNAIRNLKYCDNYYDIENDLIKNEYSDKYDISNDIHKNDYVDYDNSDSDDSVDDNDETVYEIDTGTNYRCMDIYIYTFLF
jgi:hypothetical protein